MLDVGCGEGVLTVEWAERLGDCRVVGIDLDDPKLRAEWERARAPNLEFRAGEATRLPFGDDEFDMAAAIEVLEHVPDPRRRWRRWRGSRAATCSCRSRASRSGAASTWRAAPTCATSATRRAT